MRVAEVIELAEMEGLLLESSVATGNIKATGNQLVVDLWAPIIRQRKLEVFTALRQSSSLKEVLLILRDNPKIRYAVKVDDPDSDPVVIAVGIRNIAVFELRIPFAKYDAFALMGLVGKHTQI